MTFIVNSDYSIYLDSGDTGTIRFTDLPTDRTYIAYVAFRDTDTNSIVAETSGTSTSGASTLDLSVTKDVTDLLTVPYGETYKNYYWGLKLTNEAGTEEQTMRFGSQEMNSVSYAIVYPKQVEGAE